MIVEPPAMLEHAGLSVSQRQNFRMLVSTLGLSRVVLWEWVQHHSSVDGIR